MKKIKDFPLFRRPREKLVNQGAEALSDTELLAVLLGSGVKGNGVLQMARAILQRFDRSTELDVNELLAIDGVGLAKACQLMAALEFARRRFFHSSTVIRQARDVLPQISHIAGKKQEYFLCIALNGAKEVIGNRVVTIGLLNSTQVHPREVFADVIAGRADSVILAHNHPSGVLKASPEDIAVTNQMLEAGRILGISLLDHIIITRNGYLSFKEEGLL
ncbi:hypothetical protein BMS3Bbin14_00862 [bacterium BMS3Bbin14]|nr:hypothetical protein BMS3Abin13_02145 [bacterium BMS3Abin13]GBE52391.1 hypothetical protein BMS3Bbin14_00862 [bacterium BMS3Bbin14]HDK44402.1 DNA repair protein RadC [Desulfobacteraceae bacterium]